MTIETIKCEECGSTQIVELPGGRFVCSHCEAIFERAAIAREVSCSCGAFAVGRCADCGQPVCQAHAKRSQDGKQLLCDDCSGRQYHARLEEQRNLRARPIVELVAEVLAAHDCKGWSAIERRVEAEIADQRLQRVVGRFLYNISEGRLQADEHLCGVDHRPFAPQTTRIAAGCYGDMGSKTVVVRYTHWAVHQDGSLSQCRASIKGLVRKRLVWSNVPASYVPGPLNTVMTLIRSYLAEMEGPSHG